MGNLWNDIMRSLRMSLKNPGFTVAMDTANQAPIRADLECGKTGWQRIHPCCHILLYWTRACEYGINMTNSVSSSLIGFARRVCQQSVPHRLSFLAMGLCLLPAVRTSSGAEPVQIPLTAGHWTTTGSVEFVQHKGFDSIELKNGAEAVLHDLVFGNGTLEFDVESTASLGAGIGFRRRDKDTFEDFYLRPYAKCPEAGDCIQYAPQTHGVLLWDLFPRYQTTAPVKEGDWNHVKLVVSGQRMDVHINGSESPTMRVGRLEGDASSGGIVLQGPGFFAHLTVAADKVGGLSAEPEEDATSNDRRYVRNWRVSPYSTLAAGQDVTASDLPAPTDRWQPLAAERAGLVNISRVYGHPILPSQYDRALVWIETTIVSSKSQSKKVDFGWAREAWIFVNGKLVYADKNLYWDKTRSKPPDGRCSLENGSFLLPLQAGDNRVVVALASNFYGWAFVFRLNDEEGIRQVQQERK